MIEKEKLIGFDRHEYHPMLRPKSEEILKQVLKENQPKKVLEIGTFIGYSAAMILQNCKECFLVTLEKNQQNAKDAEKNLSLLGFDGRFSVVCCDAFDFLCESCKIQDEIENLDVDFSFDLIFLDGPKGQYFKYLPYLKKLLQKGGVLIADDILFYGLVKQDEKIEHKHRALVNNLRKFLKELQEDKEFETKIYDFEDGLSVSIKK